jgi:hypothetical protein
MRSIIALLYICLKFYMSLFVLNFVLFALSEVIFVVVIIVVKVLK